MKEPSDSKSESGDNPRGGKQFLKKKVNEKKYQEGTILRENISGDLVSILVKKDQSYIPGLLNA